MAKVRVRVKRYMQPTMSWLIGAKDLVLNCCVKDVLVWIRGEHLKPIADPRKQARSRRKGSQKSVV